MECAICYDPMTAKTGQATLSCAHAFHLACIVNSMIVGSNFTCPCCRHELGEKEIPELAVDASEDESESIAEPEEDPQLEQLVRGNQALTPYMWAHMNRTGVDPYAAFSKLWTSILTIQAQWRGYQTRQVLRARLFATPAAELPPLAIETCWAPDGTARRRRIPVPMPN